MAQPLCKARSARGTRPCKKYAILGGTVCDRHGGRSPQVKRKAAERLNAALMQIVDPKRVLAELGCIALSNIQDLLDENGKLLPINKWPEEAARAVKSVEVVRGNVDKGDGKFDEVLKVQFWDKPRAHENAMKHHGQLTEKVELSGQVNIADRLIAGRKRVASARGNSE